MSKIAINGRKLPSAVSKAQGTLRTLIWHLNKGPRESAIQSQDGRPYSRLSDAVDVDARSEVHAGGSVSRFSM